ncbi:coiled-coil domain-containing protein 42 homolog [Ciona intestinalis]
MPLAATSNQMYHLNLEPQKKNVFVTQLNDRPEEDDDIRRFPVVQETADQLVESGINTLQKTSLLRKAVEMEVVDKELAEKREEFRIRMEKNKNKEDLLRKRQEKIKERVTKFDKFLKDNDAKRSRALRKYQIEVKDNKMKTKQLQDYLRELEFARKNKEDLVKRLQSHKKFEDYMMQVIDALPENYLEMTGDNMIHSVIQRYEGLSATHQALITKNLRLAEEMEDGNRELEQMKQEREEQRLLINSQMAELQKYQEKLTQRVQRLEQKAGDTTTMHRAQLGELGRITMAIDNLSDACHTRNFPPLNEMSYLFKLTMINQHFHERLRVQKLVQKLKESKQVPVKQEVRKTSPKKHQKTSEPQQQDVRKRGKLATRGFLEQLTTINEKNEI